MIKESGSFYSKQQTAPLCLISKYMTDVAGAHYIYVASRNFSYYCHCTLYSKGHFDSRYSENPPLMLENSILSQCKKLTLKYPDKHCD